MKNRKGRLTKREEKGWEKWGEEGKGRKKSKMPEEKGREKRSQEGKEREDKPPSCRREKGEKGKGREVKEVVGEKGRKKGEEGKRREGKQNDKGKTKGRKTR
jgi:hypothetical protein